MLFGEILVKIMEIRDVLCEQFPEKDIRKWFDPLEISCNESTLLVIFPHVFFLNMFLDTFKEPFERAVSKCFQKEMHTEYTVLHTTNKKNTLTNTIQPSIPPTLNETSFTFDTFFVNHKNYFPLASAKEVVEKNAIYNPFILYGESGSGKTHLCKAMFNAFTQKYSEKKIFFGSFEDLRKVYTQKEKSLRSLTSYEIFILDDFHEMQSFPEMQHDFLFIFNAFHDQKKQIVLTTSERIGSLDFLEPCLKSRLEWGLMVTLKQPDLDVRLQFVQTTCKDRNIELTTDQMLTLAQHFFDFRSLQGCLLKILAFQKLVSPRMEQDDFQNILQGLESPKTEITHDLIISIVAENMNVPEVDIFSAKRHHNIVLARQTAMYLCRKLLKYSFPHIGSVFGGKDHSTVIYACRKIEKLKREDPDIKGLLHVLSKQCYAGDKASAEA